jgi:hypothetical protein
MHDSELAFFISFAIAGVFVFIAMFVCSEDKTKQILQMLSAMFLVGGFILSLALSIID